jgi:hypothetical protein
VGQQKTPKTSEAMSKQGNFLNNSGIANCQFSRRSGKAYVQRDVGSSIRFQLSPFETSSITLNSALSVELKKLDYDTKILTQDKIKTTKDVQLQTIALNERRKARAHRKKTPIRMLNTKQKL